MAVWFMHTKTFSKVFAKAETPKNILSTQFVIVSTRIRKTGENQNVVSVGKLFPRPEILSDYRMEMDKDFFKREYWKQLEKNKVVLAILIQSAIIYKTPIIFLCTPKEYNLKYFKILREYVMDTFGYPMINYLKYKKNEEKTSITFNASEVLSVCDSIIKTQRKKSEREMSKTKTGRKKLVERMSKDEMQQKLKDLCLFTPNLSKAEMRELLELFFVS